MIEEKVLRSDKKQLNENEKFVPKVILQKPVKAQEAE